MEFTHFTDQGQARMVDVTEKEASVREAVAAGTIFVSAQVLEMIESRTNAKGDVLSVAATAGVMGAKKTAELIPMCHILPLTGCSVEFEILRETSAVRCRCRVKVSGKTGVEMEALTGVTTALLTVYDMCKAVDKNMEIGEIYLEKKTGGKSGEILHTVRPAGEKKENSR